MKSSPSVTWLNPAKSHASHSFSLHVANRVAAWDSWPGLTSESEVLQLASAPGTQQSLLLSGPFQDLLEGEGGELGASALIELVLELHPAVTGKGRKERAEMWEASG